MTREERQISIMQTALLKIAIGRVDNGMPINRHTAQDAARDALSEIGIDWSHEGRRHQENHNV